ncbi:kinase-like protein [Daldinia caldariorum]|uniref:kinase-like protein n=1 Tax=Daldinia caldariorum TaxID=326644 RepID=UPI002007A918|nr:kinase-like protein [Daldinia caldariorum]KAI1463358.1 kinase-like protein [Daldinia caldariorum]
MEVISPLATDYYSAQPPSLIEFHDVDDTQNDETIYYEPLNYIYKAEDVQLYNEGGHHPVHLDAILNNRYKVVHKLGNGGFGLVWLCRDTFLHKWRAVKILTANQSAKGTEKMITKNLSQRCTTAKLERNHILLPSDQFWLVGPNGRHLCFVMPVLGWTVSDWRLLQKNDQEQTHIDARNICRQIIESAHFLHKCGICHGDFRPGNILMKLGGIDDLSQDQLLKLMGEPVCLKVETLSGQPGAPRAPNYCVAPADESWSRSLSTKSIAVIDFGESFFIHSPPRTTGIPDSYAAPEVLLEGFGDLGTHSDVWALACTLFEVWTNSPLVGGQCGGISDSLGEMEYFLGPLPSRYRTSYDTMHCSIPSESLSYSGAPEAQLSTGDFTPKGQLQIDAPENDYYEEERAEIRERSGYQDIFEAVLGQEHTLYRNAHTPKETELIKYRYAKEDVLGLADLLRRMLKYDPKDRIGMDAVMSHHWARKVSKGIGGGKSRPTDERMPIALVATAVTLLLVYKLGKGAMI